jgi:cytochrome c553
LPIRILILLAAAWQLTAADARSILAQRCLACHGQAAVAGLRLDTAEGIRRVAGAGGQSILLHAVRGTSGKRLMPPGRPLDASEIQTLEAWVRQGAPFAAEAQLWSVQPLPAITTPTSIDQIVRQTLAAKSLVPNPRADRRTLTRRLHYDLTGLPADQITSEPLEALVDRLLASPHFGERWGRHWLDVARYGEEDFSGTAPRYYPQAWRYRDWVIAALNRDLPYDLFLRAQIAGDLLPNENQAELLPALGLFGAGPWYYGIAMPAQARADERHDRVDMISRGMLGLTVACARCHDHKYDAISQQDYYALSGVFASSAYRQIPLADAATVNAFHQHKKALEAATKALDDFEEQESLANADSLAHQTARYLLNAERCRRGEPIEPDLDNQLLSRFEQYVATSPVTGAALHQQQLLAALAAKRALDEENRQIVAEAARRAAPVRRSIVLPFGYRSEEDFNPGADVPTKSLPYEPFQLWNRFTANKTSLLRFSGDDLDRFLPAAKLTELHRLRAAKKQLEDNAPKEYPYLMAIAESDPWDLPLDIRGNPHETGGAVPRAFPALLGGGELRQGSGRLALSYKVSQHPLAARVAVNRVWRHLFGVGLVRTASNFGAVGDRPAQALLLEYLAARFVQNGYSVKQLIREIVLSETYQATAQVSAANDKIDAENRYFWRMNRRRADAESLRDSMLASAARLDTTLGGESQPVEAANTRRTVYARVSRYQQDPTLALFDFPSASVTCEQRVVTNVPLQKLYFLNSDFLARQAEGLAARVKTIEDAYRLLFLREPSPNEKQLGQKFLATEGWKSYAQVLLSSNEFAFID